MIDLHEIKKIEDEFFPHLFLRREKTSSSDFFEAFVNRDSLVKANSGETLPLRPPQDVLFYAKIVFKVIRALCRKKDSLFFTEKVKFNDES